MSKKRQTHNYTSELELKSLLIRVKNKNEKEFSKRYNSLINKYVGTHTKLTNMKYPKLSPKIQKRKILRRHLKDRIVQLSEETNIDKLSYERFGEVILLMIKHILTKPNFSRYTYKTEFYSDAIHKILKYLHNFNHKLISERTNVEVNAFAYISQIIHNSIVYIIKQKKKEQDSINQQVSNEIIDHNLNIIDHRRLNASTYGDDIGFEKEKTTEYKLGLEDNIVPSIKEILEDTVTEEKVIIRYPGAYKITMEEYDEIKPLLKRCSILAYK